MQPCKKRRQYHLRLGSDGPATPINCSLSERPKVLCKSVFAAPSRLRTYWNLIADLLHRDLRRMFKNLYWPHFSNNPPWNPILDESSVIFEATFKERYYTIHDPTIDIGVFLNISAQSLHKKYFLLNTDSEHRLYSHYTMNALTILSPHYTLTILSLYTDHTLTIHWLCSWIPLWELTPYLLPLSSLSPDKPVQWTVFTGCTNHTITKTTYHTNINMYIVHVTFHPKSDLKQKLFRTLFVLVDTLNCNRTSLH